MDDLHLGRREFLAGLAATTALIGCDRTPHASAAAPANTPARDELVTVVERY